MLKWNIMKQHYEMIINFVYKKFYFKFKIKYWQKIIIKACFINWTEIYLAISYIIMVKNYKIKI